ncbi:MAG TPA: M23 family metallopeptidase, partial [Ardenticatenaceae bacterium]|nr:M23 family metallopeptidase [Ardenticatenaceae bacterium]
IARNEVSMIVDVLALGLPVSRRERASHYRHTCEMILQEVVRCRALMRTVFDPRTIDAWQSGDERARITIRSLGCLLDVDLPALFARIAAGLARIGNAPLADFSEILAPDVFASVDSVRPAESKLTDGYAAAESLHYAWTIRSGLLRHILTTINAGYSPPRFTDLETATSWIRSYANLLQEAETVLDETQMLLHDEAIALQSFLDQARARLQAVERQARTDGVLLKREWRLTLDSIEDETIARLAAKAEELGQIAFEPLAAQQGASWWDAMLQHTQRYAPRLGLLLLTVAGASAAGRLAGSSRATPRNWEVQGPPTQAALRDTKAWDYQARFPVLARRSPRTPDVPPGRRARSAVDRFFAQLPQTRGRQTLLLRNNRELDEALAHLEGFGYARDALLRLLALDPVDVLRQEISLDLRMSAGGRPLLFPLLRREPTEPVAGRGSPAKQTNGQQTGPLAAPVRVNSTDAGVHTPSSSLQSPISNLHPPISDPTALATRYADRSWPSLEAMPTEVRQYFRGTIQDVADFFNVRPGDIAGILRAEQNNSGWRLHEPRRSSAGASGVAQVIARTWNGWSHPEHRRHSHSLAEIERYGGLGFDWAAREQWHAWKAGRLPLSALEDTNADPILFENGVAAIARHLVQWGLTRDAHARDQAEFNRRLADAVAVYNSGRPLAESHSLTQSAANHKTVGDYVAEVLATSEAWERNGPYEPQASDRNHEQMSSAGTPRHDEPLAVTLHGAAAKPAHEPPVVVLHAAQQTESLITASPAATTPISNFDSPVTSPRFSALPLDPMPPVFKPFGAAVTYQAGGRHSGIDVAGPEGSTLYAVADGVVSYVGPLYCDQVNACRGGHAVVLDLGGNAYALYSHNAAAFVQPGERVSAGQAIGRQGDEGYSFGAHLHFEVHVGAPFSGNWREPFQGGEFVDPLQFLPSW